MLDFNNRIGYNPYIMEIGFPYNLDIDTEEDWKLVNVIWNYFGNKSPLQSLLKYFALSLLTALYLTSSMVILITKLFIRAYK